MKAYTPNFELITNLNWLFNFILCYKPFYLDEMNQIKELTELIAVSLFLCPCNETELMKRDFLKGYYIGNIQRFIMKLEKDAIYYKGETMFIYKTWAKKNLKRYDLDFDTKKEKQLLGMTEFAKRVNGL